MGDKLLSTRVIWKYNLCREGWKKYSIPNKRGAAPEPFYDAVAVAIKGTIYTFGGRDPKERNALWTLNRTERGGFTWCFIKPQNKKESPSPRRGHTGWEYAGKLWVFGGAGPSPEGYLNCHGDVTRAPLGLLQNNQLLSYNPNTNKWENCQYFGAVPIPRFGHASAIIRKTVFLFGGHNQIQENVNDLFQLDMHSLTWTQLGFGQASPQARGWCSLTATSNNQLVLHGGCTTERTLSDTWILDGTSYSWRLYTSMKDHHRSYHAATLGLSSSVIIIGGDNDVNENDDVYNSIFWVQLEPRSLQELASRTIYKHKANLPWKCLPKKLMALVG